MNAYINRNYTPHEVAKRASFVALINCYLREVDSGVWHESDLWESHLDADVSNQVSHVIELSLGESGVQIALEVSYVSLVGRHHFENVYVKRQSTEECLWQPTDYSAVSNQLIREIYRKLVAQVDLRKASEEGLEQLKQNELELLSRGLESEQLMANYITVRQQDESLNSLSFIDSEQAQLFGHWLHPTPKSRQGIAFWEQDTYCPELKGEFSLHYFSVDRALVKEGTVLDVPTSEIVLAELGKTVEITLRKNHVVVPIHPLQAQWLLLKASVKDLIRSGRILYLGDLGEAYRPTSSVRTVYKQNSEWMYKLSIPVRITNSFRSNMRDELEDGMAVDKYLRKSGFLESRPVFKVVDDPGFITVELPGEESVESGFEVILRRNIFQGDGGDGICSILALVQDPIETTKSVFRRSLLAQLIDKLSLEEGRCVEEVALDWFADYWYCAIESIIMLYDRFGIALEAHQQNSLLDVSRGYPTCYYYRDNQGFYLSKTHSDSLVAIDDMLTMSEMFYEDNVVFEAISYYVFTNQLFAVMYRLGADRIVDESTLVKFVQNALVKLHSKLRGVGKDFVCHMLHSPNLSFKANLLARVNDVDELHAGMERAVYTSMSNPIYLPSALRQEAEEQKVDCHAL